mgnify:CR=1 FL=1
MKQDIEVSVYANIRSNTSDKCPLIALLRNMKTNPKLKEEIEQLRLLRKDDEKLYKRRKSELPAFTASGIFSQRKSTGLETYNGYICIDIDGQDNPDITDFSRLRDELSKIRNIDACFLSASGEGVFCFVRVGDDPKQHKQYFNALSVCFKELGINVDEKCSDISRLRFSTFDVDGYLDENDPVPFTQTLDRKPTDRSVNKEKIASGSSRRHVSKQESPMHKVERTIEKLEEQSIDITDDYNDWIRIGFAFAREFGEEGRDLFHRVSSISPKYDTHRADVAYDSFLSADEPANPATLGTFFHLAKEAGVVV